MSVPESAPVSTGESGRSPKRREREQANRTARRDPEASERMRVALAAKQQRETNGYKRRAAVAVKISDHMVNQLSRSKRLS